MISQEGFHVLKSRRLNLTLEQASDFYYQHEQRFFYNRLVNFMSSGPISVHILQRVNAIYHWRGLLGNTKVYITQHSNPQTIRGLYGLTDTRNVAHGSDSAASADIEIKYFFPELHTEKLSKLPAVDIHQFLMQDFAHQPSLMKLLQRQKSQN